MSKIPFPEIEIITNEKFFNGKNTIFQSRAEKSLLLWANIFSTSMETQHKRRGKRRNDSRYMFIVQNPV